MTYKIICEKEYYPLIKDDNKTTIGLCMMVKNEEKRIKISLDSVRKFVKCFIIYDTGSTDNTIDVIQKYCEEYKINLYLIQGEFVNFCESRNVYLEYAEKIGVTYCLLLDCNDELQNGEGLIKCAEENLKTEVTGFLVCQVWFSGKLDKYYNVRFLKNRKGWRYRGVVHEWLKNTSVKEGEKEPIIYRISDTVVLYQDRTKDDDKSLKRFYRDYDLLLAEHKKDKTEPRTVFYLAQTCACIHKPDEAFYYYKLRSYMSGFEEERFHSFMRCGDLSQQLGHDWYDVLGWYMKAIEHSNRAEPYTKIAHYYNFRKKYDIAFMFLLTACSLEYPHNVILFVDKECYDYSRYHLMGIVAFYVQKYDIGFDACMKAINLLKTENKDYSLDKKNLEHYTDKISQSMKQKYNIQNNLQTNNLVNKNITTENIDTQNIITDIKHTNIKQFSIENRYSNNTDNKQVVQINNTENKTYTKIYNELKKKYPNLSSKKLQQKAQKQFTQQK